MLLLWRNFQLQSGIGRVAMAAFVLLGMVSCESCLDLSARKVILEYESKNGRDLQSFDGSVRDERQKPRCVLPLLSQGYRCVCACGLKLEQESNGVFELSVEIVG